MKREIEASEARSADWLKSKLDAKVVERCAACNTSSNSGGGSSSASPIELTWTPHPFFDVVFDWRVLNDRAAAASSSFTDVLGHLSDFNTFVTDIVLSETRASIPRRRQNGDDDDEARAAPVPLLMTSIALDSVWEAVPLDERAQRMFSFRMSATDNSGAGADSHCFTKGPRGQVPSRDSAWRLVRSVTEQLRKQGVLVTPLLGDVVIFARSFDEALHRTAAVHKCLTSAGLKVDGANSAFEPRVVLNLAAAEAPPPLLTTLDTATIEKGEMSMAFLNDVFFTMVDDLYSWFCVAPPATVAALETSFHRLVAKVVATGATITSLSEADLAAVAFRSTKRQPIGPQRWSRCELRLAWMHVASLAGVAVPVELI